MDAFDYIAIDASASRQKGTLSANSERDARALLRDRGLKPVKISLAKQNKNGDVQYGNKTRGGKVKHKDLTMASRQLAILIGAGSPIEDALNVTAQNFSKSPMRQKLLSVRGQVMEGARLSDAMKSTGQAFPELYQAMVASAETSGQLGPVLDRLADDLEAEQAIRRKITAAIVYPIVLCVVAVLVVTFLLVFIIPQVVSQFATFGKELPALTRFVIGASEFLKSKGLYLVIGLIAAVAGLRYALRKEKILRRWHRLQLKLPLIGKFTRNLNAARFSRTMSGLLASGTPALSAMETAQFTIQNLLMRDVVSEACDKVREGAPISKSLRQGDLFPPLVVQMIAGGEASGEMAKMFGKSADYLESEFESAIEVLLALLEPLIIIFLAGIVLLIIGAIFLPILKLNTLIV